MEESDTARREAAKAIPAKAGVENQDVAEACAEEQRSKRKRDGAKTNGVPERSKTVSRAARARGWKHKASKAWSSQQVFFIGDRWDEAWFSNVSLLEDRSIESATIAAEALNTGRCKTSSDFCAVYSKSSAGYHILYRDGCQEACREIAQIAVAKGKDVVEPVSLEEKASVPQFVSVPLPQSALQAAEEIGPDSVDTTHSGALSEAQLAPQVALVDSPQRKVPTEQQRRHKLLVWRVHIEKLQLQQSLTELQQLQQFVGRELPQVPPPPLHVRQQMQKLMASAMSGFEDFDRAPQPGRDASSLDASVTAHPSALGVPSRCATGPHGVLYAVGPRVHQPMAIRNAGAPAGAHAHALGLRAYPGSAPETSGGRLHALETEYFGMYERASSEPPPGYELGVPSLERTLPPPACTWAKAFPGRPPPKEWHGMPLKRGLVLQPAPRARHLPREKQPPPPPPPPRQSAFRAHV